MTRHRLRRRYRRCVEFVPSEVRTRLADERADLMRQLAEVESAVAGLRDARSSADADDEHDPEGAPLSQQWSHGQALLVSLRERLAENAAATTRLEADTYGACIRCGQPISPERLAARSSASLCIRCAAQ
jgi:DnaK suppressor protein